MFKVASENQSYPYQVTVGVIDEAGKKQTQKFKVRFKRVSQDELESIQDRLKAGKVKVDGDVEKSAEVDSLSDNQLLHEVVIGFEEGVLDSDGSPLQFNADNLDRLTNTFPVRPAMVEAFFESIGKVLQKN